MVIGFSLFAPLIAFAAPLTQADCLAQPGGPVLSNDGLSCILIGGGGVLGGYWVNAEWRGAPVHHDVHFGDLVDISGTAWYANYKAQWKVMWPNGVFQ